LGLFTRGEEDIRFPQEKDPNEPTAPLQLGDWLVRRRLITRRQLFFVLKRAYRRRFRIGDSVVAMGLLDRQAIEEEVRVLVSFNAFCGQRSAWTRTPSAQ
jgi:hypothetical protein